MPGAWCWKHWCSSALIHPKESGVLCCRKTCFSTTSSCLHCWLCFVPRPRGFSYRCSPSAARRCCPAPRHLAEGRHFVLVAPASCSSPGSWHSLLTCLRFCPPRDPRNPAGSGCSPTHRVYASSRQGRAIARPSLAPSAPSPPGSECEDKGYPWGKITAGFNGRVAVLMAISSPPRIGHKGASGHGAAPPRVLFTPNTCPAHTGRIKNQGRGCSWQRGLPGAGGCCRWGSACPVPPGGRPGASQRSQSRVTGTEMAPAPHKVGECWGMEATQGTQSNGAGADPCAQPH